MRLEISTGGCGCRGFSGPQLKNDNNGRQKANSGTGARCREASWSQWLTRE